MSSPNRVLPPAFTAQLEVLAAGADQIETFIDRHEHTRKPWTPGELVDFSDDEQLDDLRHLRERARGLSPAIKVAVMLNLLTEEGLPHFHRIISEHVGTLDSWSRWTGLWTAEEDRHGNVMRDYVRDAALFMPTALDRLQFDYLNAGFDPAWAGSPYRLLAYTSLQERATQAAHANTARLAGAEEPLLQRVLAHLAGDESRHCAFYRDAFGLALAADVDAALVELQAVAPKLAMPGGTILGYQAMAEISRQAGIFGPREYAALVRESMAYWDIAELTPQSAAGRVAQDQLMLLADRIEAFADRMATRRNLKTFEFSFLRERVESLA